MGLMLWRSLSLLCTLQTYPFLNIQTFPSFIQTSFWWRLSARSFHVNHKFSQASYKSIHVIRKCQNPYPYSDTFFSKAMVILPWMNLTSQPCQFPPMTAIAFTATFLFATGKVWMIFQVYFSSKQVSDVCHTHIASGFPSFSPRPCLMFGFFFADLSLEHASQLEWYFLPESKSCSLHQLIWVDGWCPREQKSQLKPRVCPLWELSVLPWPQTPTVVPPPSHWPPWMWKPVQT